MNCLAGKNRSSVLPKLSADISKKHLKILFEANPEERTGTAMCHPQSSGMKKQAREKTGPSEVVNMAKSSSSSPWHPKSLGLTLPRHPE